MAHMRNAACQVSVDAAAGVHRIRNEGAMPGSQRALSGRHDSQRAGRAALMREPGLGIRPVPAS